MMNKRQYIESVIASMISEQLVKPGDCIPSIRSMSTLYNVSATPVIEAYKNLEKAGILASRPKSRYVVATSDIRSAIAPIMSGEYLDNQVQVSVSELLPRNLIYSVNTDSDVKYPFDRTSLAAGLLPGDEIAQCIARNLKLFPTLVEKDLQGYDDDLLVEAIAKWMVQYKCIISKKEIIICDNGTTTPLLLALQACSKKEQPVIVASPCSPDHHFVTTLRRNRAIPVRSTPDHVMDLDSLERTLASNPDVACVIVSSCFASPTGAVMSEEHKLQFVDICTKYDIAIIEDDCNGDLSFSPNRPCTIKSIAPDRTILISSFSNTLAPGLQVNWACCGKYTELYRYYRDAIAGAPPALIQNGLGAFVQSKAAWKQLSRIRRILSDAMKLTRDTIHENFPENVYVSNPTGGYNLWVRLPNNMDAGKLKKVAEEYKISFVTGQECAGCGGNNDRFSLNCSIIAKDIRMLEGVRMLGKIASQLVNTN